MTEPSTDARLAEIQAREQGATKGPWRDIAMGSDGSVVLAGGNTVRTARRICRAPEFADAEFIAKAREDVPWLLAQVEQLRYERRLLGRVRILCDQVAEGGWPAGENLRQAAGDMAQRIVDEIGHSVTDEPALGPSFRAELALVREALNDADRLTAQMRDERDRLAATVQRAKEVRAWLNEDGKTIVFADDLRDALADRGAAT